MNSQSWVRFFGVVVVLLLVASGVSAQTAGTGALTGTVTDASGAVIAKATVTATNTGTGQSRVSVTGTDGGYKFSLLPPGAYRVRFEAPGFTSVEVPTVDVAVTETPVLDQSLAVGSQSQQVTVEGTAETIQTASSTLGGDVSAREVTDLPLSTRNYTNLLAMSAGTNADVNNATSLGRGWQFTSVNGGNDTQNNFQMDGAPINDWASFNVGDGAGYFAGLPVPNPDSIQEFKIQTSNFDAGYGRNAGGNVNVITKSGTNAFHGTAFEFFRNTDLNANEWFYKRSELSRGLPDKQGVLNQNQYGGSFGGPIIKDKLFFFVSDQETQQKNGYSGYGLVTSLLPPIPANADRGTCPAGFTLITQCSPAAVTFINSLGALNAAAVPQHGGTTVAADGSNINPVAINILQLKLANGSYYFPSPAALGAPMPAPGKTTPITFSDPAKANEQQFIGNWDYVLNSKHTVSGRFNYTADPTNAPFACGVTGVAFGCLPGAPVYFKYSSDAALVKLTSILTNNVVNEARVSYQRYQTVSQNFTPFTNAQVGITGFTPAVPQLTLLSIGSSLVFGAHPFFGLNLAENQYQYADQLSWSHGKHTVRVGVEYAHNAMTLFLPSANRGQPSFSTFADFLIGGCGVPGGGCTPYNGTAFSNLSSVGTTTQFRAFNGQLNQTFKENSVNAFVQDDFKLFPRFTLNVGVRWEYDGYPYEKNGLYSNFWPSLLAQQQIPGSTEATGSLVGYLVPNNFPGPVPAGVYVSNLRSIARNRAPLDDFAPRLGFAWQPFANTHLAIRGGVGTFIEQPAGEMITLLGSVPPYENTPSLQPSATLANPFVISPTIPGPPGTPGWPSRYINFATGQGSNLTYRSLGQDFTNGTVYEWNLNTQYEFLPTWVLELGYVGSHGFNLMTAYPLTGQTQSNYPYINLAQLAGPGAQALYNDPVLNPGGVTTNTVANVQTRVPYLGLGPGYSPLNSTSSDLFSSLQVTVRKQLSHGLQFQAAYTWARSFSSYYVGNPNATAPGISPEVLEYGVNGAYRPHRLVFNYTWNIPNGNMKGIMGKVTEGWLWSGVTTIQDGDPLVITNSNGGTIFTGGGAGPVSLATFCPGQGLSNIVASGSVDQRVAYGLQGTRPAGNSGYFNTGTFVYNGAGATPAGYCAPAAGSAVGNGTGYGPNGLGNATVLGPGQYNWDMSLAKTIRITESQNLQFRTEFFNTFNHPQFQNPATNAGVVSTFGQITATSVSPRLIQFALKYNF